MELLRVVSPEIGNKRSFTLKSVQDCVTHTRTAMYVSIGCVADCVYFYRRSQFSASSGKKTIFLETQRMRGPLSSYQCL